MAFVKQHRGRPEMEISRSEVESPPPVSGRSYKVLRVLHNQVFRIRDGGEYLFTFLDEIKAGSVLPEEGRQRKSPDTARVRDENSHGEGIIILNAVLKSELLEGCPNHGYVGKTFRILALGFIGGKGYKSFEIEEVSLT